MAGLLGNKPRGLLGLSQGPYGPMGSGVNIGEPIDTTRPMIDNGDGSFSTERTMTMQGPDGLWYNVPTIAEGNEMSPGLTEWLFMQGLVPHVGQFGTLDQAERSARIRTNHIGQKRGR